MKLHHLLLFVLALFPLLVSSTRVSVSVDVSEASSNASDQSLDQAYSADLDTAGDDTDPDAPIEYTYPNARRCSKGTGYCVVAPMCQRAGGRSLDRSQSSDCFTSIGQLCCQDSPVDIFSGEVKVNETGLANVLSFLNSNPQIHSQLKKVALIDFNMHIRDRRFFYWSFEAPAPGTKVTAENLKNQQNFPVAHGSGSDPERRGIPSIFSNTPNSLMSSLGFNRVAELYTGEFGFSARLDGLSQTNSATRPRAIVMHPWYDATSATWGCFGLPEGVAQQIERQMSGRGIVYAFGSQTLDDSGDALVVKLQSLSGSMSGPKKPAKVTTKPRPTAPVPTKKATKSARHRH